MKATQKQIKYIRDLMALGWKVNYTINWKTLNTIQANYIIKDILKRMNKR